MYSMLVTICMYRGRHAQKVHDVLACVMATVLILFRTPTIIGMLL